MRGVLRLLVPMLPVFAVVYAIGERQQWRCQRLVFDVATGVSSVQYFASGPVFVGREGPFVGDGGATRFWNFVWRQAGWAPAPLAAAGAAMAVYLVRDAVARRRRCGAADGITRCGTCGYELRGLREPVCPECGTRI